MPDIGTDPVQAPEASQAVAVVADHVSVAADPIARSDGTSAIVTVGNGFTVSVCDNTTEPPAGPTQVSVYP